MRRHKRLRDSPSVLCRYVPLRRWATGISMQPVLSYVCLVTAGAQIWLVRHRRPIWYQTACLLKVRSESAGILSNSLTRRLPTVVSRQRRVLSVHLSLTDGLTEWLFLHNSVRTFRKGYRSRGRTVTQSFSTRISTSGRHFFSLFWYVASQG